MPSPPLNQMETDLPNVQGYRFNGTLNPAPVPIPGGADLRRVAWTWLQALRDYVITIRDTYSELSRVVALEDSTTELSGNVGGFIQNYEDHRDSRAAHGGAVVLSDVDRQIRSGTTIPADLGIDDVFIQYSVQEEAAGGPVTVSATPPTEALSQGHLYFGPLVP